MKHFSQGAAFGVGCLSAPWILALLGLIVLAVLTHLWFLGVLALCVVGGMIVGFFNVVTEAKRKAEEERTKRVAIASFFKKSYTTDASALEVYIARRKKRSQEILEHLNRVTAKHYPSTKSTSEADAPRVSDE